MLCKVAGGDIASWLAVLNKMQDDGVIEKYAVGGAVASSLYLEPSLTADVDVFVMLKAPPGKRLVV